MVVSINNGNANIMVSVWMITYNHENYIAQALESALMQKTNFKFEIVIGEDCSTDKTRSIIEGYKKEYPETINAIYQDENVGAMRNGYEFTLPQCKGKYLAPLEGDDYWTDPYKLQKQVDFLENNKDYALSTHNAIITWEGSNRQNTLFNKKDIKEKNDTKDVIENFWFIPTASVVFRKDKLAIPKWLGFVQQGDFALVLILSTNGYIHYTDKCMSVYRKNPGSMGAVTGVSITEFRKLDLLSYFDLYTDFKYHLLISKRKEKIQESINYKMLKESGKYKKYLNIDYLIYKWKFFAKKMKSDHKKG